MRAAFSYYLHRPSISGQQIFSEGAGRFQEPRAGCPSTVSLSTSSSTARRRRDRVRGSFTFRPAKASVRLDPGDRGLWGEAAGGGDRPGVLAGSPAAAAAILLGPPHPARSGGAGVVEGRVWGLGLGGRGWAS